MMMQFLIGFVFGSLGGVMFMALLAGGKDD